MNARKYFPNNNCCITTNGVIVVVDDLREHYRTKKRIYKEVSIPKALQKYETIAEAYYFLHKPSNIEVTTPCSTAILYKKTVYVFDKIMKRCHIITLKQLNELYRDKKYPLKNHLRSYEELYKLIRERERETMKKRQIIQKLIKNEKQRKELSKRYNIKISKKCKGITILKKQFGDVKITSVAYCYVNDKWDSETGKRIAYEKMRDVIFEQSDRFESIGWRCDKPFTSSSYALSYNKLYGEIEL